jgi:hypothetical protein
MGTTLPVVAASATVVNENATAVTNTTAMRSTLNMGGSLRFFVNVSTVGCV